MKYASARVFSCIHFISVSWLGELRALCAGRWYSGGASINVILFEGWQGKNLIWWVARKNVQGDRNYKKKKKKKKKMCHFMLKLKIVIIWAANWGEQYIYIFFGGGEGRMPHLAPPLLWSLIVYAHYDRGTKSEMKYFFFFFFFFMFFPLKFGSSPEGLSHWHGIYIYMHTFFWVLFFA